MTITVVVFDFDGTLVSSNALKYEAYFPLFPDDERHTACIRNVLETWYEESRYTILEKVLRQLGYNEATLPARVHELAARYNDIVLEGVKTCPECPGAEEALQRLCGKYSLYLSSTTPESALRDILEFRGWIPYFRDIFGYPEKKADTLRHLLEREQIEPSQIMVVGDGESDRVSAKEVGCEFFDVNRGTLKELVACL